MTHPLDLHPLREVASAAWNEVRKPQQPEYENLPMEVKSKLLDTATRVESGDPNVAYECIVAEKLAAKAEAAERLETEEDNEVVEATTQAEKDVLDLKGKLPEDFPSHAKLHEAGINTYTQLNKVEDLTTIDGIGPKFAQAIKRRLKADAKSLNE
jgi:predicted flap endonuclease-1-like 5' DNA nuclease